MQAACINIIASILLKVTTVWFHESKTSHEFHNFMCIINNHNNIKFIIMFIHGCFFYDSIIAFIEGEMGKVRQTSLLISRSRLLCFSMVLLSVSGHKSCCLTNDHNFSITADCVYQFSRL